LLPIRRALSSVNAADFSWRNRIAAWEGALQITAENPFLGTAWGQPEPMYEHYYLPPKLTERGAFELNDYLMLGATLGIPALFCFGMYLWLSLTQEWESRKQKAEIQDVGWLRTVCHAGAIVLLIGFWFDGGLFKLPTAATFWILLELGNARHHETNDALNHE
jgi:O-antigen ligase